MAFPAKLLNEGENIVVSTRTHVKVLIAPLFILIAAAFAAAFAASYVTRAVDNSAASTVLVAVIGVVAVMVVLWWVVRPFVDWFTSTYTFTNRRFIQRTGFIAKEGRTIPLNRISGVDFEIGIIDRIFGCGTLVVSDASEQGRVPLHDIPQVERVQMLIAEELHRISGDDHRADDGT